MVISLQVTHCTVHCIWSQISARHTCPIKAAFPNSCLEREESLFVPRSLRASDKLCWLWDGGEGAQAGLEDEEETCQWSKFYSGCRWGKAVNVQWWWLVNLSEGGEKQKRFFQHFLMAKSPDEGNDWCCAADGNLLARSLRLVWDGSHFLIAHLKLPESRVTSAEVLLSSWFPERCLELFPALSLAAAAAWASFWCFGEG